MPYANISMGVAGESHDQLTGKLGQECNTVKMT